MEAEEPPRKRSRSDVDVSVDSDDSDATGTDVPEIEDVTPTTRDETYYRADGDCVIRVGDVLFKIHRFLLVRDSGAFGDMFSMPQGDESASQIMTDENPVVLHDEVDDFRALCWSIYALPTEYMDQATESKVDIGKLVSLYLIAQKYQFESHETFARNLLKVHCANIHDKPPAIKEYFSNMCSSRRLASLLKISLLTDDPHTDASLTSVLQKVWLFRLQERPESSLSYALTIAETLGLRKFRGQLYYHQLISVFPPRMERSVAFERPVDDLEEHQKLPFYQGYMSLQLYWAEFLNSSRRKFKCPPNQHHYCNRVWTEFWPKFKLDIIGTHFDPLEAMKLFLKSIVKTNKETFDITCIMTYVNDKIKELENSLPDHFLDPLPTEPTEPLTIEVD